MDSEHELTIEERLAHAMIDLRKGPSSYTGNSPSIEQRRDYLIAAIADVRRQIDILREENDILTILKDSTESVQHHLTPFDEIPSHLIQMKHGRCHDTRDTSIQTDPVDNPLTRKAERFKLIKSLSTKEKMLQEKLKALQPTIPNNRPELMLVKIRDYDNIITQIESISSDESTFADMSRENIKVPLSEVQTNNSSVTPTTSPSKVAISPHPSNTESNVAIRPHEASDDEGVQLLLSMKRNVFNCKCGEFLNSISDWSEHQRICTSSTEKTMGEQCPICKKIFLTCVALNIHSTKKHNKKKVRTDSVMHCPCGQSFTAKWRQNCVHKLNSHGRHCKAFKEIETQCTVCKKGFIDRKSLEYHGLKAHKLAVPINS